MLRRRFAQSLVVTLATFSAACTSPPAGAAGHLVRMQLVDRATGEVLAEHRHRGVAHVAGRPGDRYAVRMSNRSGGRVLVVLSVDGINAITGETATPAQTGYVLGPWQTADITGWRKSDAEAAAFYFTALPDSYAARTDRPRNVGVIGLAVFRERAPLPRPVPFAAAPAEAPRAAGTEQRADAAAKSSADASAAGAAAPRAPQPERLGTGHGEREHAPISHTSFERASPYPAELVQLRYDSHANLVAAGIIVPMRQVPDPFPGYVPDPR